MKPFLTLAALAAFAVAGPALAAFFVASPALAQDAEAPDAAAAETATLTVTIAGLEPLEGQVMVAAYADEDAYSRWERAAGAIAAADAEAVTVVMEGLAPGVYAISAIHDRDGDNELDFNFMRIPTEPTCAANDALGRFGPPSFADSSVTLAPGDNHVALNC